MRILPPRLRQWVYFQRYHHKHDAWANLFASATLSACPAIKMHDLVPGDAISGSIAFTGFYEWELTQEIAQHALGGGLLVDVGANMGYFSLLWAGLSVSSRVIAFEPSPGNVARLTKNIALNGFGNRITVISKAAGDRGGAVTFDTGPADQTGWGGIAAGAPENSIIVPMVRLDQQLPDTLIDVLKIDTEGADALVLFGCERLLKARKIKRIYFEENPDKMQRIGVPSGEAQRYLQSMNYECHRFRGSDTEFVAYPA